ncbi:MAG: HIT domain-containing protein [Actinomycetota bacterium]|nr:HIT domain-containing protein [Actinomycetota bacterium]
MTVPDPGACCFCSYLDGTSPYTILERNELTAVLVTFEQRGQGHVLVIPIAHRETILDLTPEESLEIMDTTVRMSRAIASAFDPEGIAVWQNNGVAARQTVPHFHMHVTGTVPGGSTIRGRRPRLPLHATDAIAARLAPHLMEPAAVR